MYHPALCAALSTTHCLVQPCPASSICAALFAGAGVVKRCCVKRCCVEPTTSHGTRGAGAACTGIDS